MVIARGGQSIAYTERLTTSKQTIRTTKDTETSSHWAIVYLGIGSSKKEEFHILNRHNGTYLTATRKHSSPCDPNTNKTASKIENTSSQRITAAADDQDDVTCTLTTPWHNVVRWSIVPARNRPGLYL